MALKTGTAVSLIGPVGPASIVTVTAPPGPNVGVVGGYAVWNNSGTVLLYGPKTSSGWTQTSPDAQGNTLPVSVQLTGATGAAGAAGAAGSQILVTSGVPSSTTGNVGDVAIDAGQGFVYGPKSSSGWSSTPLVSTVGPAGPKGDTGAAATLPVDYTGNSFVAAQASGTSNPVQLAVKNSGATVFKVDNSGNATVGGTLGVSGATQLGALTCASSSTTGNQSVNGTLTVVGSSTLAAVTASGTLGVTGATTLAALTASSASVTNNASVGGTLGVSGASTLAAASATNLTASGTLGVSGTSTLAAVNATNIAASGTLAVTGATTAAAITSTGTVTGKALTLTSGGGGVLTFADGTTMSTAATGTGGTGTGSSSGAAIDTMFMGTYWSPGGSSTPTSYVNFINTIQRSSGNGSESASVTMGYAGTVYSIQGWSNGSFSGTVNIALYKNGAITPWVATPSTSGGGWSATPTSAISFNAGDTFLLYFKSSSTATDQAWSGFMSVQPTGATAVATAAALIREPIDMGGYQYGSLTANAYAATKKLNASAGTGTINTNTDFAVKLPWPGSIVGYSLQQNSSSAATTSLIYSKNGTNFAAISVGSGAGNFSATHAVGTYTFAAGDKIQLLTTTSNGGNTDVFATMYVQWSA